jgi:hypothetical protein
MSLSRRLRRFRFKKLVPALSRRDRFGIALLADDSGEPLVVARDGRVRVVEWSLSNTVWSEGAFGFGRGMDPLLWRSILWVARKPFVMAAFPPFGRFRFDDCQGLWRSSADLAFVDVLAEHHEVPSLCICLSSLDKSGWMHLAARARRGQVEICPHVQEPELGIFNVAEDVGGCLARRIRDIFAKHGCPMATSVSDHNHEITASGIEIARKLGMHSRMNVLRVGEKWTGSHRRWFPTPFGRLNYALDRFIDAPDLFTAINHFTSFADAMTETEADGFVCTTFGGFTGDRWDFLNGNPRLPCFPGNNRE